MLRELNLALAPFALEISTSCIEEEKTSYLVSPRHDFWRVFSASPEYQDNLPDPMDRFSKRVLHPIAKSFDGAAVFPSDGPPYPPFIRWALASHQVFLSPVNLLVHVKYGLMVSFRVALLFDGFYEQCPFEHTPCATCAQPCLTACDARALTKVGYDVPLCKSSIRAEKSQDRYQYGCRVRRACPVSKSFNRDPHQAAYHMRAFLGDS